MNYVIITLGCKVNQAESGGMGELLRHRGHHPADSLLPPDKVDMVVVNTCTVTASADRKSRNAIRRLAKEYPRAVLGVCGCLSQTNPADLPPATLLGGSSDKGSFVLRLEEAALARSAAAPPSIPADSSPDSAIQSKTEAGPAVLPAVPAPQTSPTPPSAQTPPPFSSAFDLLPDAPPEGRTRLFLKIQDGCENRCHYCRIPDARGPCRSRPPEDVLAAARKAAENSVAELVLCGIEITSYQPSLVDLTETLCRALPKTRIRLGSLYPSFVGEDFCRRLSALPNLCPHFHLSLQNGDSGTLRRMGRRYDTGDIQEVFARLGAYWDSPAISCDILCGYPGEGDENHKAALALVRRLRPSRLHVFPYSRRQGTVAAALPDQVPTAVKQIRAKEWRALDTELRRAYAAQWIGTEQDVLFEDSKDGLWQGHTTRYVPVVMASEKDLQGRVMTLMLGRDNIV